MDNYQEIICFICGKQFIIGSLKGHVKKCEKKFNSDQEKLSDSEKIKCPLPPIQLNHFFSTDKFPEQDFKTYMQKMQKKFNKQPKSRSLQKQNISRQKIQKKGSMNQQFRKPRTLVCPICGRQFGLTSLKIHHPQCIQKFKNEQNKKPKDERRQLPILDKVYQQMIQNKQQWNAEEIENFNILSMNVYRSKGLVKCPNCQRSFFVEALEKHKKNCVLINGKKNNHSIQVVKSNNDEFSKPKVLMCYVCGRQFGTTSLLIHQKVCVQKYLNQEKKKPKQDQRGLPQVPNQIKQKFDVQNVSQWNNKKIEDYNKQMFNIYNSKALERCPHCGRTFFHESLLKHLKGCNNNKSKSNPKLDVISQEFSKPRTLVCYICGRQFGLTSLNIHQPQCLIKYNNEQSKKQIFQRKALPEIDQKFKQMIIENNWTSTKIQEFNDYMGQLYKKLVLQKCDNCGRTFNHESLLKHMKNCKLIAKPSIEKSRQDSKSIRNQKKQLRQNKENKKKQSYSRQKAQIKKISKIDQISSDLQSSQLTNYKTVQKQQNNTEVNNQISVSHQQIQQINKKHQNIQINKSKVFKKLKRSDSGKSNQSKKSTKNISINHSPNHSYVNQKKNLQKQNLKLNKNQSNKNLNQSKQKTETKLQECKYCKKNFESALLEKHLIICQKINKYQQMNDVQISKKNQKIVQNGKIKEKSEKQEKKQISGKQIQKNQNFNQIQQVILQTCKKCLRKFSKVRIQYHSSICKGTKGENQSQRDVKNKISNKIQKKSEINQEQISMNQQIQTKLVQCTLCKRKFKSDRIQKHQIICQKNNKNLPPIQFNKVNNQANIQNPINAVNPNQNAQTDLITEQVNLNLVPCKKCGRNFADNRISNHESICKSNKNQSKNVNYKIKNITQSNRNNEKQIPKIIAEQVKIENDNNNQQQKLEACQKCLRKFAKDRIEKHITICKGENKLKPRQNIKKIGINNANQLNTVVSQVPHIDTDESKKQVLKMIKDLKSKKKQNMDISKEIDKQIQQLRKTKYLSKQISSDKINKKNEITPMNKTNNHFYEPRMQDKRDFHLPEIQK